MSVRSTDWLEDMLDDGLGGGLQTFSGVQTCIRTEELFTECEETPRGSGFLIHSEVRNADQVYR